MTKSKYSTSIAKAITDVLNEDDWNYAFNAEKGRFQFVLSTDRKLKNISYVISVREDSYLVFATSPIGPSADDPEEMAKMAEFICRANFGLINGNFELDFNDGEIRYKTYVNCDGIIPTEGIIRASIFTIATMFKKYADGITDILFKNVTPAEAIKSCEDASASQITETLKKLLQAVPDGSVGDMLQHLLEEGAADKEAIDVTPEETEEEETEDTDDGEDTEIVDDIDDEEAEEPNEEEDTESVDDNVNEEEEITDDTLLDLSKFLANLGEDTEA